MLKNRCGNCGAEIRAQHLGNCKVGDMDVPVGYCERCNEFAVPIGEDEKPYRLMRRQSVSPHVPVYIIYYTAYPNPATGDIELWPDVYGYDKVIAGEMGAFLIKE